MAHENGDKQRPTKRRHVQGMLDETDPLNTRSTASFIKSPLIEQMGWMTIDELITCESKTMVFKSLNQLAPEYLSGLFT